MSRLYPHSYNTVKSYLIPEDVHDAERVSASNEVLALLAAAVWTLLHGLNIYWLFWNNVPFIYSVLIHIILTIVITVVTIMLKAAGRDIRHLYMLCITSGAASILGTAGTMLACVMSMMYGRFTQPFAQWYRAIYPDFGFSREEKLYDMITSGKDESTRDYHVVSFRDVMVLGTEQQKRRALTRMTDRFHPSFAPIYRQALQDKNNTIRVQAASSVAKIENQFTHMLMRVEQLEAMNPDDMILKLGLARFYDDYAFTGLLDAQREHDNRQKALEKYRVYLEEFPNDIDVRIEAGRLLLRNGSYDEVVTLFQDCLSAGYQTETLNAWLMEALYAAGRYAELRAMAPRCAHMAKEWKDTRPRLSRSIEFWGNHSL